MARFKLHLISATVLTLCLTLGLASAARADNLSSLSLPSVTWGYQVDVTLNGTYMAGENTAEMNVVLNGFQDVIAYCVEINQNISVGGTYNNSYSLNPVSESNSTQAAAWLLGHYAPGLGNPYTTSLATTITALQLAIWEVTYDYSASGNYSLGAGNFFASNLDTGVSTLATSFLNAMVAADITQTGLSFSGVVRSEGNQDLIVGAVSGGQTPEPGSMLLLGSAAGLLGWVRRRRQRIEGQIQATEA